MTLNVAPGGHILEAGSGEALWFSGGLLTYKTTGDQTSGNLAVAEVRAPRGSGSPNHRHHHEDEAWYILDGELTFWLGDEQRSAVRRRLRVRSPHGCAPISRRLDRGPLPFVAYPRRIRGLHPSVWIAGDHVDPATGRSSRARCRAPRRGGTDPRCRNPCTLSANQSHSIHSVRVLRLRSSGFSSSDFARQPQ